jgi:hypothetical protein
LSLKSRLFCSAGWRGKIGGNQKRIESASNERFMREALDESGIYVDWDKSESHQMQKQQCMFRKEGETLSRESLIAVLTSLLK